MKSKGMLEKDTSLESGFYVNLLDELKSKISCSLHHLQIIGFVLQKLKKYIHLFYILRINQKSDKIK